VSSFGRSCPKIADLDGTPQGERQPIIIGSRQDKNLLFLVREKDFCLMRWKERHDDPAFRKSKPGQIGGDHFHMKQ
jgi:hypothetical protein